MPHIIIVIVIVIFILSIIIVIIVIMGSGHPAIIIAIAIILNIAYLTPSFSSNQFIARQGKPTAGIISVARDKFS